MYLMCMLQPECRVGTHCFVKLVSEVFAANVNPKKIFLCCWEVPSSIRAGRVQVYPKMVDFRVLWAILSIKKITIEKDSKIRDTSETSDRGITGSFQNLCWGWGVWITLLMEFWLGLVKFRSSRWVLRFQSPCFLLCRGAGHQRRPAG